MLGNKPKKKTEDLEDKKETENIAEGQLPEEVSEEPQITKEEEYLNNWKRCQADFDNFKKRQGEQQIEMIKYANQNLILDIIPVIDNFHASTDHIPEDQKENPWVTGIMYIQKQLEKVLADNNVEEIPVKIGDVFNPEIHEAIHSADKTDKKADKADADRISKVVLKGYKLGDKIIRAVRVVVE